MPGVFGALGSAAVLRGFMDFVDVSRGSEIVCHDYSGVLVGFQQFLPESVSSYEMKSIKLILHSSIRLSDYALQSLISAYLKGLDEFLRVIRENLRSDFCLLLHDVPRKRLFILSDPLGIRKIYFLNAGNSILFSSSLPHLALSLVEIFKQKLSDSIDVKQVQELLFKGYTTNKTIFKGLRLLRPGYIHCFNAIGIHSLKSSYISCSELRSNFESSLEHVHHLMVESIKYMLKRSEGVSLLLSGGIDSSLIASLAMRHIPHTKIEPFSLQYKYYSEIDRIKRITEYLKFEKLKVLDVPCDPHFLLHIFTQSVKMLDEPNLRGAFLLRYFALNNIRKTGSKEVATGDGCDEIFCGYWPNYWTFNADMKLNLLRKLPIGVLRITGLYSPSNLLSRIASDAYFYKSALLSNLIREHFSIDPRFGFFVDDEQLIEGFPWRRDFIGEIQKTLYNALVKTDILYCENFAERLGINIVFPYAYRPLIEYVLSLPSSYKIKDEYTKFILRVMAIRYNYLPSEILMVEKTGFHQKPIDSILHGYLLKHITDGIDRIGEPKLIALLNKTFRMLNKRNTGSVISFAGLITWVQGLKERIE
ncbi:MAG: asparagine synthase-related protein [Nitrososphaeria archaeon]